jgi:uncharacterized membrane protein
MSTRERPSRALQFSIVATGLSMIAVGVLHFVSPAPFERIVPPWLPAAKLLVYLSGVAEIALGAAVLWAPIRRWAAFGLVALYIAVFPANIHMAINRVSLVEGAPPPPVWALYARLPMQALMIANALWIARRSKR